MCTDLNFMITHTETRSIIFKCALFISLFIFYIYLCLIKQEKLEKSIINSNKQYSKSQSFSISKQKSRQLSDEYSSNFPSLKERDNKALTDIFPHSAVGSPSNSTVNLHITMSEILFVSPEKQSHLE